MALNFKTLGVRALSALFFVVLLLGSLLWNYYSFTIFFFAVALIGLNEFYRLAEKMDAAPYKTAGFVLGAIVYLCFIQCDAWRGSGKSIALVFPFLILAFSLFSKKQQALRNALFTIGGVVYAVLPFALMHEMVKSAACFSEGYSPNILLGVILLIWSNDTFAYLGGSVFGKNKMIERISPGKTWEGTIFGVLVTIGSGYIIGHHILGRNETMWILLGLIVPVFATIGDLIESMLKREAGVKDSGNIMPGHGGILDRFDSLIFVTPFVFLLTDFLS